MTKPEPIAESAAERAGQASDAGSVAPGPGETEVRTEAETTNVWWPNRTGPFKAHKARADRRNERPGKQGDDRPKPHRKGRGKPPATAKHGKQKRREREIRPEDSPFAALSALRAQMNDRG